MNLQITAKAATLENLIPFILKTVMLKNQMKRIIVVSVSCGGILKAQPYGQTFTSPDFPKKYPNGVECVWKIEAPLGQLISLDVCCFDKNFLLCK